jgi:hypothetical protein
LRSRREQLALSAVSSSASGIGQVMPITAARRMYSAIAVRPIPTDRAMTRSLAPQAYFRRRTSRTFHIDNLSAGIRPPFANRKRRTVPGSDCRQRSPNHPFNRVAAFVRIGWPLSIGMAGRVPSESVAALPRNPHTIKNESFKAADSTANPERKLAHLDLAHRWLRLATQVDEMDGKRSDAHALTNGAFAGRPSTMKAGQPNTLGAAQPHASEPSLPCKFDA